MAKIKPVALALIFLFSGGLILTGVYFSGRIIPGVTIAGRAVGGLKRAEAGEVVEALVNDVIDREINLSLGDRLFVTTPRALGMRGDTEAALNRAFELGRSGGLKQRLVFFNPRRRQVDLIFSLDKVSLREELKRLGIDIFKEPVDARLEVGEDGLPHLIPAEAGWEVDTEALLVCLQDNTPGKIINISLKRIEPAVSTSDLEARKIEKVAGSFTTSFNPGEIDRTHNITLAATALDGLWLRPGAELSFNEVTGPRTTERGYRPAIVIEENNFVTGVGGGVCQVSSTLYNAALLAGLTIVERQPHGLAVSYVPPGRDATVVYGLIDLKVRNDTPFWYWLKASVRAGELVITFYTAREVVSAEVMSHVVEKISPPIEVEWVPDWPPERVEVKKEGQPGLRTRVVRVYHLQEGGEQRELVSQDFYPPLPRIILKGYK